MRYRRLARTDARAVASLVAIGVLCVALARPADVAQGRVDPQVERQTAAVLSADQVGTATGGGTVIVTALPANIVASFGINGKRPPGFVSGGGAIGRINYDKHQPQTAGRHVNTPVLFMTVELATSPSPNGTGGKAQLIGDCTATGAECPTGFASVLVYVEDNSDTGTRPDVFQISYCVGAASPAPANCAGTEGGNIRTGQIQIRATGASGSATTSMPTAVRVPLRLP